LPAAAADLYQSVEFTIAAALRFIEGFDQRDLVHGVFCSEMIAIFFQKLGIELFADNLYPHQVSPDDLKSENSSLKSDTTTENAVIKFDEVQDDWSGTIDKSAMAQFAERIVSRENLLPVMVGLKQDSIRIKETSNKMSDLNEFLLDGLRKQIEGLFENSMWRHKYLTKEFSYANENKDNQRARRLERLLGRSAELITQYYDLTEAWVEIPNDGEAGRVKFENWKKSALLWAELSTEHGHELVRYMVLNGLRETRKLAKKCEERGIPAQHEVDKAQKTMIGEWISLSKDRHSTKTNLRTLHGTST